MKLVIASTNVHKIREFRVMLRSLAHLDIMSLLDFPGYVPPYETEETFEGNAILKAEHAAKTLGHWVLADDSGLIVPSLNGLPGVRSARYAGEKATDRENRQKLLKEMIHLQDADRCAYFECCIAISSPESLKKCVKGICEGYIAENERGRYGFGYDPLFIKHEYSKTFAELEEDIKSKISHRRKAFDKMILFLDSLKEDALSH